MGSSNICWGIEMGYGAIKALKIETDGQSNKILDFAIINHSKVLSTPELDQTEAMRVALGTLVSQHDLSGARIAVSLPGHQSFARFAKLPPVEPKKVPDIVKFEAVQQIPFPLEEVEWDYQTFVSPDSPDIEVGIFAVTRQRIAEQLSMLNDVGLTPDTATLSPVAAYNALASDLGYGRNRPDHRRSWSRLGPDLPDRWASVHRGVGQQLQAQLFQGREAQARSRAVQARPPCIPGNASGVL
jgi:type IV pilus assembly protein PilM